MSKLVKLADDLAERYHAGQTDKQGKPYIDHPRRVATFLAFEPDNVRAAALLHDVLEDTDATEEVLRAEGIPDDVIDLVKLLTRDKGEESYAAFIDRISDSTIASRIKIADLLDNTDPNRGPIDIKLQRRYHAALKMLLMTR
jgi:(p)ppGpp synthase/HD superfamily hydrolase